MFVTKVRIIDPDPGSKESLLAYAEIEFDRSFVVHDVKVIKKADGHVFVDMPSKPSHEHCTDCARKIPCTARFCPCCGAEQFRRVDDAGQPVLPTYHNVAHPINGQAREAIHNAVMTEYGRWRREFFRRQDEEVDREPV